MRFAVPNFLSNGAEKIARTAASIGEEVNRSLVTTRYGTSFSALGPVIKNVGRFATDPSKGIASIVSSGLTNADRQVIWRYTNVPRLATTLTGRTTQALGPTGSAVAQWAAPLGLMYAAGQLGSLGQGLRPAGYKSIIPVSKEEDPTGRTSISAPLEAALRYTTIGGRSQLLPYKEFKEERPDILPSTYTAYRRYEFSKPKPGELVSVNPQDQSFTAFGGAIRGTARGLNDPEIRIKGMPITASGLAGAVAGVGAARAISNALVPRSKEYTQQLENLQGLRLEQNALQNQMVTHMDVIRERARAQNVKVPTKPGAARDVDYDPTAAQQWIEKKAGQMIQEGRAKPGFLTKQTELFPSKPVLTQEEKVQKYVKGIQKVSEQVGTPEAGKAYTELYQKSQQLEPTIKAAQEKTAELSKQFEPNIFQANRRAIGVAAGIGTALAVGAVAKKLFEKAEERKVKKENPVEYLKYKHGDLAAAKEALGQPQARSWQDLTPYVK